jgi:hypothetical protein
VGPSWPPAQTAGAWPTLSCVAPRPAVRTALTHIPLTNARHAAVWCDPRHFTQPLVFTTGVSLRFEVPPRTPLDNTCDPGTGRAKSRQTRPQTPHKFHLTMLTHWGRCRWAAPARAPLTPPPPRPERAR